MSDPAVEFVYATINNNIELESARELPLINMNRRGKDDSFVFNCVSGNLDGLDPTTGLFVAPKNGFYDITFFCRYNISSTTTIKGVSNTKLVTVKGGDQFVNPLGSTNSFAKFKNKYVSSSSVSGLVPLTKNEVITISLYQKNSNNWKSKIEAELIIMYNSSYEHAIDSDTYDESLRCEGFVGPQGSLKLFTPDNEFSKYALRNPLKPFKKIEVIGRGGDKSIFYSLEFEDIEVGTSRESYIETDNPMLIDKLELLTYSENPLIGFSKLKVFYGDRNSRTFTNVVAENIASRNEKIKALSAKSRKDFLKVVKSGEEGAIRAFIKGGLDPNFSDSKGKTPLMLAVDAANLEMVKLLVENGATIDSEVIDIAFYVQGGGDIYNYLWSKASYATRIAVGIGGLQ